MSVCFVVITYMCHYLYSDRIYNCIATGFTIVHLSNSHVLMQDKNTVYLKPWSTLLQHTHQLFYLPSLHTEACFIGTVHVGCS